MPAHHVITFQTMAPISAAKMTRGVTMLGSTIPVPMVCATCRPKNRKAMKLKKPAQKTAARGGNTRVDTMVAIELAASCRPFRKSNSNATAISPTRTGRPNAASTAAAPALSSAHDLCGKPLHTFPDHALDLLDNNAVDLVRDVVEAIADLLEMVVDL